MLNGREIVLRIRRELKRKKIPKYHLAETLGSRAESKQAKHQMVNRVFKRIENAASIELLQKIAAELDLSPEYFLYSDEEFSRLFAPNGKRKAKDPGSEDSESMYERFTHLSLTEMQMAMSVFQVILDEKSKKQSRS